MDATYPVKCSWCGFAGAAPAISRINAAESPELKEKVKDGSLFLWECPHCGRRSLVLQPLLYHDPLARLMVWLRPGEQGAMPQELEGIAEELEGYTLRVVSEAGALMEKVAISDACLDDIAVEICKYATRMELAEKQPSKANQLLNVPFKFYRLDGADGDLVLSFPLDGSMQAVNVGFGVYEDALAILSRNPSLRPPGFAPVDAAWLAERLR